MASVAKAKDGGSSVAESYCRRLNQQMKVVVSGSKGCIGSLLVPALQGKGFTVLELPDAGSANRISPDEKADVFVNLAWRGSRGAARADYACQLEMVKTSLDFYKLAVRLGCRRFLCPGTIGERMVDLEECRNLRSPSSVYVNAKSFLHRLLLAIEVTDMCRVVWVQLGNFYGATDSGNLVNWTLSKILAGEEAAFGPAKQPYEFTAIEDGVRALTALVTAPTLSHSCYYIGSGQTRALGEWLREIGQLAGREDLIAIGKRPDDGARYRPEWFDIAPLTHDTGYEPQVTFSDGIRTLIDKMRKASRT